MRSFTRLFMAAFREFRRDKAALFFSFAFPIIFILIFGLVFGKEGVGSFQIGIVNQSNSQTAQTIVSVFDSISKQQEGTILDVEHGELDIELDRLRSGDIRALLVIPAGIEDVESGQGVNLPIHFDPSQTSVSQIVLPVIEQIVGEINIQLTQTPPLVRLEAQSIQSHQVRNIDYLVPGIAAMSLLSLGLFGSLPMIQQRQKGILRRLNATPIRKSILVCSQILFRLIMAVVQTVIIIIVGWAIFDVQMQGNWLVLVGLIILGALTFVSLGYVVAAFVRTEEAAIPVVNVIFMPMMFLSGIFFPIEIMPDFMKPVVTAIPLSYLGDALRQVLVDATPIHSMATNIYVLTGWLVACVSLSIRFFRWE